MITLRQKHVELHFQLLSFLTLQLKYDEIHWELLSF
jgi:hypothetical protein